MLTHVGTERIETERLILRKFEYADDDYKTIADGKNGHGRIMFIIRGAINDKNELR